MIKQSILPICALLLIILPGCRNGKKTPPGTQHTANNINMPFGHDATTQVSFFDEDIEAFVLQEDTDNQFGNDPDSILLTENDSFQELDFTWQEPDDFDTQFQTVFFEYDSSQLDTEESKKIAQNIEKIKTITDDEVIVLKGKASSQGKATNLYKMALSQERAEQIAHQLEDQGISRDRLKVFGVGCTEAIANGDTHDEHRIDRCVEMYTITT